MSIPTADCTIPAADTPALPAPLSLTPEGVMADTAAPAAVLSAAIDAVLAQGRFFAGFDWAAVQALLYGVGQRPGSSRARIAERLGVFQERRRALYRTARREGGAADYFFEPVYLDEDDSEPARLDPDEFIAAMWQQGIRFGIDTAAVASAIAAGKAERVRIARALQPVAGSDAAIVEVCADLHRNDAPRQLPNGRLDLSSFQNRFPQIAEGTRLLRKQVAGPGTAGRGLGGEVLSPPPALDVELHPLAGPGTRVETTAEGQFLVATLGGFLSADPATGQLSVTEKIISREGVSARTTGNLQLGGDYEEFGDIQEKRVVEGENITVHANVFGHVASRGGMVLLNQNLVGGSATNARGDVRVKGVCSSAVVQAGQGAVTLARAENCIVSGRRVAIEHAVNCEVIADELSIGKAEGCAVAARSVEIGMAGPRRQVDMAVYALVPDTARMDEVLAQLRERVAQFGQQEAAALAEMERMTARPEVRKYMLLASKIRCKEVVLTPEQVPQFQKMAAAVGPELKAIGKLSLDARAARTEREAGEKLVAQIAGQKEASAVSSSVRVAQLDGEVTVRTLRYNPDGKEPHHMAAKDIKPLLRGAVPGEPVFAGAEGEVYWRS